MSSATLNRRAFIYTDGSHEVICDTVLRMFITQDTRLETLILTHHIGLHVTETVLRTALLSTVFIQNYLRHTSICTVAVDI